MWRRISWFVLVTVGTAVQADGPADNISQRVRPVPPPGIAVPQSDREALAEGVEQLGKEIEGLRKDLPGEFVALGPDVVIFYNSVRYALAHNEFYQPRELAVAKQLLDQGLRRAREVRAHSPSWLTETGLVVRGYESRIDGSVQPYGLIVPADYNRGGARRLRLDIWFHGRGETLSELAFIDQRQTSKGEFAPASTFVLHPYGRYCNANKFAGEVDLFEALEHVQRNYRIDEDRIVVRGFSMGGAACWQFAVHYAGLWAAAAPGAGFAETPEFLKVFQGENASPPWYERKLWRLYDCPGYVINLSNCPTVAYSGQRDRQKQAADVMAEAFAQEGMSLVHVIGPETAHSYHAQSKDEINARIDALAAAGREAMPRRVRFDTYTLRYNKMKWVTIDGMEKHWERARVDAELRSAAEIAVHTSNVSALSLSMHTGRAPLDLAAAPRVQIDGQTLAGPRVQSDRSWSAHFRKQEGKWAQVDTADAGGLRKRHGLQGPIDDAFWDAFVFVRPTGKSSRTKAAVWVEAEMQRAIDHWRRQFRGEPRVMDDTAVGETEIAAYNLVLWGDEESNQVLKRIAANLPIRVAGDSVRVGTQAHAADRHAIVLIYPNPLNPRRYAVLNSGFTFREYDYLNNARQTPKLPDWAVIDVDTPPSTRAPGKVVAAGFFGEQWELTSDASATNSDASSAPKGQP